MSRERIEESIKPCEESWKELEEALALIGKEKKGSPLYSLFYDACVKRFEVLFEYVWKVLKVAAEYQGREAPGPRPAIQEGVRFGWIEDPEFWAAALEARNGSVHDYLGVSEQEYLGIMTRFAEEMPKFIKKLRNLK